MQHLIDTIENLLQRTTIPSISVQIVTAHEQTFAYSAGFSDRTTDTRVTDNQIYDLASLTKVLVGGSILASILDTEPTFLTRSVAEFIPGIDPRICIGHLANHSSGLPAHIHFYTVIPQDQWGSASTRDAIFGMARTAPLQGLPGSTHCYSDLGFIVLCEVLEHVDQHRLDSIFTQRVLRPLGIDGLSWGHPDAAATELCPIRDTLVRGQVHDLNCAAMGGISAHAGLFGTTTAVSQLAAATLGIHSKNLPQEAVQALWQYAGPGSHRGCWDTISPGYTSTGQAFPSDAVGHLGYTGTSLWIAPSRQTTVTVLTNRVHPTDDLDAIRRARPLIHDSVAHCLGWGPAQSHWEIV